MPADCLLPCNISQLLDQNQLDMLDQVVLTIADLISKSQLDGKL